MDIFAELKWRGLIHQTTDDENLGAWLGAQPRTVYVGFDPTADSLHVGSLLPLMTLRRFQIAGHRPIALVGGATGMIGDPSGKSQERNLLSIDQLRANVVGMEQQMRGFLDFSSSENPATLVNNFDWMRKFSYLDFLRDIGKNFPVNVMMSKDSVRSRLDREDGGLSYTEFSYMLLQAYDFAHLNEAFGCELQFGGSDQWGNITAGIDLGRRLRGVQLYGITCPLLTKADGTKMGKTESGTVWLSAERTSPYEFYQYWINVTDDDVGKCLRFLTELPREAIEALDDARAKDPEKKESQTTLAKEVTRLVHGDKGLEEAERATSAVFDKNKSIKDLDDATLGQVFADMPSKTFSRSTLAEGLSLMEAFVETGLAKSKSEARRTIQQGGAYINDCRCQDFEKSLTEEDLASETVIVLRSGKKKYALLKFES